MFTVIKISSVLGVVVKGLLEGGSPVSRVQLRPVASPPVAQNDCRSALETILAWGVPRGSSTWRVAHHPPLARPAQRRRELVLNITIQDWVDKNISTSSKRWDQVFMVWSVVFLLRKKYTSCEIFVSDRRSARTGNFCKGNFPWQSLLLLVVGSHETVERMSRCCFYPILLYLRRLHSSPQSQQWPTHGRRETFKCDQKIVETKSSVHTWVLKGS